MSRLLSVALTIPAVKARDKTVSRRAHRSWAALKPGDHLTLVEKGQGIPKGGKVVRLAEVEIVDVRVESLGRMLDDLDEFTREGFPHLAARMPRLLHLERMKWLMWWCSSHGMTPSAEHPYWVKGPQGHWPVADVLCRRIEWRYLDVVAA
jgi:hypothetical protein